MSSRLKLLWLFILLLSLSCGKGSGGDTGGGGGTTPPVVTTATFTNPLLSSGPDPWIIKYNSNYYYSHTLGNRIAIWKTAKVSDLKNANPQTIWSAPVSGANSKNVWAPEIHFLDNKWYAYYTAGSGDNSSQRTFVLENTGTDPLAGTWTEKGKIGDPAADYFSIDGTILTYNNKNYFIWSGQASATDYTQRLYIARLSNPWTLETSRSLISSPQYNWEMMGAPQAVNEGPEILKNAAGKIFLIYSASGCWTDDYALGILTLKDGGDPLNAADWTKTTTPVFTKNITGGAFGPGHNAFFKSADGVEDWIIYHANSQAGQGCGDNRSPRIQKFSWNGDGTPNFGTPLSIYSAVTKPSGE